MKVSNDRLYPALPSSPEEQAGSAEAATESHEVAGHQFRLQKISELEAFLRSEIESHDRLHKNYRRVVNVLDGKAVTLGMMCVAFGAVGAGLLASGIGFIAGFALEGFTGVAGLLDVVNVTASRRCSVKQTNMLQSDFLLPQSSTLSTHMRQKH